MTLAVVFELLATPGVGYVWAAGELKFIVQGTQLHFDTVNPVRVTANALAVGKNIAVFRFDGTQPVAADRHNLWLNNVLATTKSGAPAATLPALTDCTLGNSVSLDRQFEGYIAHQELSTSLLDPSALYTALAAMYL